MGLQRVGAAGRVENHRCLVAAAACGELEGITGLVTQRRGIDVVRDYRSVPLVQGDPEKLQQLFLNLILNAADAMGDAGGELTLSLSGDGPERVQARVADDGPGIEPQDLERVFEPFFTTKEAGQGSGLGLMIARGIALDHGGDLSVASEPGRGSTFVLDLPLPGSGAG